MNCTQCAATLSDEAAFCHQCGHPVGDAADSVGPRERLMNAVDRSDDEPERELWQGGFSRLAMIGPGIGGVIVSIVLLVVGVFGSFGGTGWGLIIGAIVLIWVGLFGRLLYRQLSEHYYLTNLRFIHERGILWRVIDRIEAIDIDDVSFEQGPVERLLGVGTIRIRSSDLSHPEMDLPGIEKVREVAEMLDEVRRQERRKRGLHIEAV